VKPDLRTNRLTKSVILLGLLVIRFRLRSPADHAG